MTITNNALKPSPDSRLTANNGPLSGIRVCDLSGQLAGAGSTRFLGAFGAQVIRVEDPSNQGAWDILRGAPPYVDERRGTNLSGSFNNHNIEKLGVTINLRVPKGRELIEKLIAVSDVVTENFSAGVMDRLGLGYEQLKAINPDIIYVSNSGFGHDGPYASYKTFGPIVQALSGLTFTSGTPDMPPAGWGYSYMDHMGGNFMALAVLAALHHRNETGEGQWVDMSCTEAGLALAGPSILDYTVNGRGLRRPGSPDANRDERHQMAPHGIYPAAGEDDWVAVVCRDDREWEELARLIDEPWAKDPRFRTAEGRLSAQDELDEKLADWSASRPRDVIVRDIQQAGAVAAIVARPEDRIERDPSTGEFGLWPTVHHREIGDVRVDGIPVHLSETDWSISHGSPCLGEHTDLVLREVLGLSAEEIDELKKEGVS